MYKEAYERFVHIGDLVLIAAAKEGKNLPRYALFSGETEAGNFRFTVIGTMGWGRQFHGDHVRITALSPFRLHVKDSPDEYRVPAVLVARGPFTNDDLRKFHETGFPVPTTSGFRRAWA